MVRNRSLQGEEKNAYILLFISLSRKNKVSKFLQDKLVVKAEHDWNIKDVWGLYSNA